MPNDTANQPLLLTLKGSVTIHFLDGQTLEGEYASQDVYNIFLTVDDEPLMIPRSQIRFIKGSVGQTIEQDSSLSQFAPGIVEEITVKSLQGKTDVSIFDTDVSIVESARSNPASAASVASDFMGKLAEEEEEDDTTVFLETESDLDVTVFLDEEDDVTLRLDEEEDDDDSTLALKEAPPVVTAYLDCIAGPHAGERFQLQAGITTLGRSKDNIFALSNDKEISRRHGLITAQPDGSFVIEDRGSLNGIIIDDVRIEGQHPLREGQNILIGVSLFIFHEK